MANNPADLFNTILYVKISCQSRNKASKILIPDRRSGFHSDTRDPNYGFFSVTRKLQTLDQNGSKTAGFGALEKYTPFRNIKCHSFFARDRARGAVWVVEKSVTTPSKSTFGCLLLALLRSLGWMKSPAEVGIRPRSPTSIFVKFIHFSIFHQLIFLD